MQNEIKIRVECNLPVLQISLTNDLTLLVRILIWMINILYTMPCLSIFLMIWLRHSNILCKVMFAITEYIKRRIIFEKLKHRKQKVSL